MNNLLENRICYYCQKTFEIEKKSRKKYCSDTCRVYASQERNGRRAKREPEPLKVPIDDLSQQIEQQSQIVKQWKQKYEGAKRELHNVGDRIIYQQIGAVKNEVNKLRSAETITLNDSAKIEILQSQLRQLEHKEGLERDKETSIPILISKYWMNLFLAQKKLNKLKMAAIQRANAGYIPSDNIDEILKATTYYEFDYFLNNYEFCFDWDDEHKVVCWTLAPLGKVKAPFSALFYGECFYSIISMSMWMAANLRNEYQAKVLYILDDKQDYLDFLERLNKIDHFVKHPDFKIKIVKSRGEIEQGLQTFIPDFIFINNAQNLRIDGDFIRKIQSRYSDTSIFCLSEKLINTINESANVVFELSEEYARFKKGGSNYYRDFLDYMYD